MKILVFTSLFPNAQQPNFGVFIKNRMAAVQEFCNAEVKVVAPVPYFPDLPLSDKWGYYARIPRKEVIDGIEILHPRYVVTPKVGMTLYGFSMFIGALNTVRKLQREFPFDIIDGHFIYPDGLAAVLLGKVLRTPVVLSARGSDINLYSRLPLVRGLVKTALSGADHSIAVCQALKDVMAELGGAADKITVIPNGIDPQKFHRAEKVVARETLGLPAGRRLLISVGALIELKGMHILLDALGDLKQKGALDFFTCIIGKGEERSRLERSIRDYGLEDHVALVGEVPNAQLVTWYNAADLFFLGSSREGWPNVISEALACGTPVVATPVSGIPEIIKSNDYGLVVNRDRESFARGIVEAFEKKWDFEKIHAYGKHRTWEMVAGEVYAVFSQVLGR